MLTVGISVGAETTSAVTVCVATPTVLLAVKTKLRSPTSPTAGVKSSTPVSGVKATLPAASSLCSTRVGAGLPLAATVNALATPTVAPKVLALVKAGATAAFTTVTLTVWVATPALLLAMKVNVRAPSSATGGV